MPPALIVALTMWLLATTVLPVGITTPPIGTPVDTPARSTPPLPTMLLLAVPPADRISWPRMVAPKLLPVLDSRSSPPALTWVDDATPAENANSWPPLCTTSPVVIAPVRSTSTMPPWLTVAETDAPPLDTNRVPLTTVPEATPPEETSS